MFLNFVARVNDENILTQKISRSTAVRFIVVRKVLYQSSHHYTLDRYRADEMTGFVGVASNPEGSGAAGDTCIVHKTAPYDNKLPTGCGRCILKMSI